MTTWSEAELVRLTVSEVGIDELLTRDDAKPFLKPDERQAAELLSHRLHNKLTPWTNPTAMFGRRDRLRMVRDKLTKTFPLEDEDIA